MKKVFFALIFGFSFISFVKAEEDIKKYEEECLSIIEKPKVSLSSSYGRLRYNFEKDSSFLRGETEKKFEKYGEDYPKDFEPKGLTQVQDGFVVKLEVGSLGVSHGKQCVYPESIDIFWGYYLPVIYIANDLAKGTCLYDLTLRHERVHMMIYIEALDYYLPKLKDVALSLFDKKGVKIVDKDRNLEFVAKELHEEYARYVEDIVNVWRKEIENEQMELDSIKNYVLETKICSEIDDFGENEQDNE